MRTRTEISAERDRQAIHRILHILDERVRFVEAEHRDNRSHGRLDDAALGIRTQTRLEQLTAAIRDGLFDQLDNSTEEAFVEVADAERYALRDEYVNAERTTLAEQLRAVGAEQAAQDAEADAFHAQRRADEAEANGECVDYAEAEAVREIEREMAIEAGDDSEIDRQVAEDDARFERAVWLAQQEAESEAAQEAWIAQGEAAVDEALDARDAERDADARDTVWSTADQIEHDQACEARLDAEGWGQGGAPF